jgi:hypothetical protein
MTNAEKADIGQCLNCDSVRWNRWRRISGSQRDTLLEIKIIPGEYPDVWDCHGDEKTEVDESWDEEYTCRACGYLLDVDDYLDEEDEPQTVRIHVTARTHATR